MPVSIPGKQATICLIQGVPESIDYFPRGDRGTPDEQKITGTGVSKMQPWGDMGKILVFGLILQKIFFKIRVAFLSNFLYYKVVANEISFPTVCITLPFIAVFRQFKSIKVEIFNFLTHFLTTLLTYYF